MAKTKHIVKRAGHSELFDPKKLYASVYSAAMSVREPSGTAELLADKVTRDVEKWLEKKTEVTAKDILHTAYKHLHAYNADAAWMYKHHRNVS